MRRKYPQVKIGDKFGLLTIMEIPRGPRGGIPKDKVVCLCACGKRVSTKIFEMRRGAVVSCGCYAKERIGKLNRTHGESQERLYKVWKGIRQRCLNRNSNGYKYYGGKGVVICGSWRNDYVTFKEWAYKNGYKKNLVIDRINPFGNYEPYNCRWITKQENGKYKRNNRYISAFGETKMLSEWARNKRSSVGRSTLKTRLSRSWEPEVAITRVPSISNF